LTLDPDAAPLFPMPEHTLLYADTELCSPYAMSAFVALVEKKLAFDLRTLDLGAGAHREEVYRGRALTARVPCLVHDGFWLTESSAIAEYLEEVYPPPDHAALYPKTARERATARQIQAWLRSDLMPIREERSTHTIFLEEAAKPLSAKASDSAERLFHVAGNLLKHGATNLFGDWSIADTDLAIMLQRLVANNDAAPPDLARYARDQWQRPSVQQWVAQTRPVSL
jgi:glutathione S-transferase